VYTFGGGDGARTASDDLRRLSLHGLAAAPFLTPPRRGAPTAPPAELQRARCDWRLKASDPLSRFPFAWAVGFLTVP
jgi:hypothetical protein